MNKSTARWIANTYQCRSCYERVSDVEAGMLCTPCHRIRSSSRAERSIAVGEATPSSPRR